MAISITMSYYGEHYTFTQFYLGLGFIRIKDKLSDI